MHLWFERQHTVRHIPFVSCSFEPHVILPFMSGSGNELLTFDPHLVSDSWPNSWPLGSFGRYTVKVVDCRALGLIVSYRGIHRVKIVHQESQTPSWKLCTRMKWCNLIHCYFLSSTVWPLLFFLYDCCPFCLSPFLLRGLISWSFCLSIYCTIFIHSSIHPFIIDKWSISRENPKSCPKVTL